MVEIDPSKAVYSDSPRPDPLSPVTEEDVRRGNDQWISMLEKAKGSVFRNKAFVLFKFRGLGALDLDLFDEILNRHILDLRERAWIEGWELPEEGHIEEKRKLFDDIFSKTCSEIALAPHRKELLGWAEKTEKGKALFVDCLMGLGKTYSIVRVLGQNPDLSAVIFMPTRRLCHRLVQDLKSEILQNNPGISEDYKHVPDKEEAVDDDGEVISDNEAGFPIYEWTRDFLEKEVYFADGINKTECPHFDELVQRYKANWIKKRDICAGCEKRSACRFISHSERAPFSRIVVTTHQQYDHFYHQARIRKWFKHGDDNKVEARERDFFIVDEDIVLSQCYQPIGLYPAEVKAFVATITDFLGKYDGTEEEEIIRSIHSLFSQIMLCDTTSIVRPIDPAFTIPPAIIKDWEKSFPDQPAIIPETLDWTATVGNHLEIVANAIRTGFTVRRHKQTTKKDGQETEEEVYMVYFPNPRSYDLSKLPPHVFFDGTKLDDNFLRRKLQNVDFETMSIDIKPLWRLKVWQNVNTDLTKKGIPSDKGRVKTFIKGLLKELGDNHRYFFLSTKETRERYLDEFLQKNYPNLNPVVVHYGNLKGINDANDCDIGMMLGSFLLSDATEVAMAMDFLQDKMPSSRITATFGNLWTWKGQGKSQRVYQDEYAVIGELARALRFSEQRQAIARTRYLFHDVDFYILSKDRVTEYEPFAILKTDQFRSDLFPPRPERLDRKYKQVKEVATKIAEENGSVREMDIHRKTGIHRSVIRSHLTKMVDKRILVRDGKAYKLTTDD